MPTSTVISGSGLGVRLKLDLRMVETLTDIWQRVLQRPTIGLDENFFNVGGTIESADLLFAEIAHELGRELPSAAIYHAPSIAALARLLEQPALPLFSPFVPLKSGSAHPPLHIVHGLAGIARFSEIAAHIKTAHPVYGIQAKGIDGLEDPLDCVEDMAHLYLDALKVVQPQGPYFLIGYSFGGLVAFEMAQRLTGEGHKVGLLAMIDAYPDPQCLSQAQRVRLTARRALRYVTEVDREHPLVKPTLGFARRLERRLLGIGYNPGDHLPPPSRLSLAHTNLVVKEKAYIALARYRPGAYRGKIKFLKSAHDTYYPDNPAAVWSGLAEHVEVATVPGDHLNLVTTHFKPLAEALTRFVQQAATPEPAP